MKAPTLCSAVGCGEFVARGRCPAHEREHRARRPPNPQPSHWRMIRASFLKRHPSCECEACFRLPPASRPPATDVHHRVDRADGGTSEDSNLQALAHGHHSRITASRIARVVR